MTETYKQKEGYRQFLETYKIDIFREVRNERFFYRWRNFPVLAMFMARKFGVLQYKAEEMFIVRFRAYYTEDLISELADRIYAFEGKFYDLNFEEQQRFQNFYRELCDLVMSFELSERYTYWGANRLEYDFEIMNIQEFEKNLV